MTDQTARDILPIADTESRASCPSTRRTRRRASLRSSPSAHRPGLRTCSSSCSTTSASARQAPSAAPGYSSVRPNTCAPLAQTLRLNGYSTAQFGECHEVPVWQTSPMGPFDAWPTGGGGFEHFFGFLGGETNQYYPGIYEGTTAIEPDKTPEEGYHFTEDMTDRAITWVRQQTSLMPDKPFFVYYAPGATHAPHHESTEWSDKYRGRFDLNVKNKSHAVTAEVEVPEGGAQGVMIAQGGAFARWSLYVHDGRPRYCYNLLGRHRAPVPGRRAGRRGPGRCQCPDDLLRRRGRRRRPLPVSTDYAGEGSVFTGTVNWVQIDLGEDANDADHFITPDERFRVAMARQ